VQLNIWFGFVERCCEALGYDRLDRANDGTESLAEVRYCGSGPSNPKIDQ
jgi:hypothetical protein